MSILRKKKLMGALINGNEPYQSDILVRHSGVIRNKKSNSYEQMKRKAEKYINTFLA